MLKIDGKNMIEVPSKAVEALGISGDEDVGILIDTATKRLIYQFWKKV